MYKITFIGLSRLESLGIKWGIVQNPDCMEMDIQYCFLDTLPINLERPEKGECYIISSDLFSSHLEVLMPCKTKVVVVCHSPCHIPQNIKDNEKNDIAFIYNDTPAEQIMKVLSSRLSENITESDQSGGLSLREIEVLRELASGKTNKEIANDLSISVNTVITHRKNISTKLGIKSVSGLSLYAIMNGVI